MTRWLPKSLFGRILAILLLGLFVSHAVGSAIYLIDREAAVRAVGGLAAAQRIANLAQLVRDVPREWRERIVAGLSDPTFRVTVAAQPPAMPADGDDTQAQRAIAQFLIDRLGLDAARGPRVSAISASAAMSPPFAGPPMARGAMMHGYGVGGGVRNLQVAIPLADGPWLVFATALPDESPMLSWQFLASMATMVLVTIAATIWAVRSMTTPLAALSAAAERFGTDLAAPPMAETGSTEVRRAARTFNTMQARLRELIENRTRMLAAISHDLRTPLTLLRLRSETVPDVAERDKMQATIAEMDAMIGTTLAFARDEATTAPRRMTDVTALVAALVDDRADAGLAVAFAPAPSLVAEVRPDALKRAIANLIDNALKYAGAARVAIRADGAALVVTVDDDGPGIPEADLERVFQPFYRLEDSRSRETGGIGLGLAIALSIAQSHGGTLKLANRSEGGLRATLSLPI